MNDARFAKRENKNARDKVTMMISGKQKKSNYAGSISCAIVH